jgi:hypothetical protein
LRCALRPSALLLLLTLRPGTQAAGGPPPGNLPGGDARWTARPPPPPPLPAWDGDAERWRSQTPLLAPETLASLVGRGFAVQDGFLPPAAVAASAAAAAALRPSLRFSQLQRGAGRGDSFTTLRLAAPGATSLVGDLPLGEAGQETLHGDGLLPEIEVGHQLVAAVGVVPTEADVGSLLLGDGQVSHHRLAAVAPHRLTSLKGGMA